MAEKEMINELLIKPASGISFQTPVKLDQVHIFGRKLPGIAVISLFGLSAVEIITRYGEKNSNPITQAEIVNETFRPVRPLLFITLMLIPSSPPTLKHEETLQ